MRRSNGYGTYRGRRRTGAARAVLIGVVVCLALLICAFLVLSRFLVYTEDGARLEIPFFQRNEPKDPDDVGLVVDETQSPEPTVVVESRTVKAVLLPVSSLTDGTAAGLLQEAGATAAVFDMKTDEGMLGYVSGMQEAVNAKTSQSDPMLNAAIAAGNNDSIYTIARISCFRDRMLSTHRLSFSVIGKAATAGRIAAASAGSAPAVRGRQTTLSV